MTHASLFIGIGGFDYAAALLVWINIFDCEIDAFCRKVLEYHFPNSVHYGDITKQIFKEWRGKSMCFPEDSLASLSVWPDNEKERTILVRDNNMDEWKADFFSNYKEDVFRYGCVSESYIKCIPYNEQTKHLLGTKNDI